jgi:hypothetical protein
MLGTGTYADLRTRIASVMNKDDHHLRHHLRRQLVLFRNKNQTPKTAQAKETAETSQRQSEQGEGFHSRLPTLFYTTVLSLTNRRLHAMYFHSSGSNDFATSNSAKRSFCGDLRERDRERRRRLFFFSLQGWTGIIFLYHPGSGSGHLVDTTIKRIANPSYWWYII